MATVTTTKKRKSTTATASSSKKAKVVARPPFDPEVNEIISNSTDFEIPHGEKEVRAKILELAQYARVLEEEIQATKPREKSDKEVEVEANKLANAVCSGIKKQMSWKPSCKHGSSKWVYDGVCQDPKVFGKMLGLDGPPTFKMKKFSIEDFENAVGDCQSSARYSTLYQKSEINVRWQPDEGTFKLSGTYGA